MLRFAALSVLVLEAACATAAARAQYGSIRLRHYGDPTATPRVFSVQEGRIVSPELDVVQDQNRITTPAPSCVPALPTEALTFADTSFEIA